MRTKYLFSIVLLLIGSVSFAQSKEPVVKGDTIHIGNYITITHITPNIYRYIVTNGEVPSNGLVYFNEGEAILVDAPAGEGITESLLKWITNEQNATVNGVIITHWHAQDRMGGVAAANSKHIPTYSSEKTIAIAKQKKQIAPQYGFKDSLMLQVGNSHILLKYPGPGHTDDNIVVWFPDDRVLFGGCLVKDMRSKDLGYTKDADLMVWPETIKNVLLSFPSAKIIVPGHGGYGSKGLLYHTLDLIKKQSGQ
jgi:metallo-beta-lactamase class B